MGYNGFLPNADHVSIVINNHEQGTVHAEQNAISDAASRGVSVKNSTAYITHYPCINCFKILAASGIKEIKYLEDYKNDSTINKIIQTGVNINISKINIT
jgi:dCMP deaminase